MKPAFRYALLSELLRRPNVSATKLGPETALSILVADQLRTMSITGEFTGVWCHLANEGKRSAFNGAVMKAMGMIPGAADFVFTGPWGHGWIELKVKGRQEVTQQGFQKWCEMDGSRYAVCRSVDEVLATLRAWKAIP